MNETSYNVKYLQVTNASTETNTKKTNHERSRKLANL
jgi:hypothetical protein